MSKAVVADVKPVAKSLGKGETYFWCQCGRSKKQPFCDGSHAGTDFTPLKFVAEESGDAYLCMCKQTKSPPYCDGSHKHVQKDETDKPDKQDKPDDSPVARSTKEEPYIEQKEKTPM